MSELDKIMRKSKMGLTITALDIKNLVSDMVENNSYTYDELMAVFNIYLSAEHDRSGDVYLHINYPHLFETLIKQYYLSHVMVDYYIFLFNKVAGNRIDLKDLAVNKKLITDLVNYKYTIKDFYSNLPDENKLGVFI